MSGLIALSRIPGSLYTNAGIGSNIIAFIIPMIGFLGACVVSTCYRIGWLTKRKYMELYVIELSYLLYIFGSLWVTVYGEFID